MLIVQPPMSYLNELLGLHRGSKTTELKDDDDEEDDEERASERASEVSSGIEQV